MRALTYVVALLTLACAADRPRFVAQVCFGDAAGDESQVSPAESPPPSMSIADAIAALDQIDGIHHSQSGPVLVLLAAGDEAVDPLIEVLETDTRETQPATLGGRTWPLPVREVARMLLRHVLPIDVGDPADVREYWAHARSLTAAERRYERLVENPDDERSRRWLTCSAEPRTDAVAYWSRDSTVVEARGESLRARTSPSITDLLVGAVLHDAETGEDSGATADLIAWEPSATILPTLRRFSDACMRADHCGLGTDLTIARVRRGDPSALSEWAARLVVQRPVPPSLQARLAPGWLWPERSDVQDAIANIARRWPRPEAFFDDPDADAMLGIPAIRAWLADRLHDPSSGPMFAARLRPLLQQAAADCGDVVDDDLVTTLARWPNGLARMPAHARFLRESCLLSGL